MVGVKEICSLLVAGSLGAGSVVAVQQARPPAKKAHGVAKPKPTVRRAASARAAPAKVADCPTQAASLGSFALADIAPLDTPLPLQFSGSGGAGVSGPTGSIPLPPGIGGGGGSGSIDGGGPDPVPPAVPEPVSWVMMVSGFGLVGFALRRQSGNRQVA
jgi:hypothetical protein